MKKVLLIICLLSCWSIVALGAEFPAATQYSLCFTPVQNCTKLLVGQINNAKTNIFVQGYSFTSFKIAKALVRAKKRGVGVNVILDKSQFEKGADRVSNYLMNHNIPVWKDYLVNIAHNKVMILDKQIVETGSFNYTVSAQKYNAENMLIIDNQNLAGQYFKNWKRRQSVSELMKKKKQKHWFFWR